MMWGKLKEVWFANEKNDDKKITNPENEEIQKPLLPVIVPFNSVGKNLVLKYREILKQNSFFDRFKVVNAYKNHDNLYKMLIRSELKPQGAPGGGENARVCEGAGPAVRGALRDKSGGFAQCNKSACLTCKHHAVSTKRFTSTAFATTHSVEGSISCKTENVIYLITCRVCRVQYVGETGRNLASRLTNHRSDITHTKNTAIAIHFNSHENSTNQSLLEAIAIEKIGEGENAFQLRKKREIYWQQTLGTTYPLGLNGYPLEADHRILRRPYRITYYIILYYIIFYFILLYFILVYHYPFILY